MTLQQAKDLHARNNGYRDWEDWKSYLSHDDILPHTEMASDLRDNETWKQACEDQKQICLLEWSKAPITEEDEFISNSPLAPYQP